MEKLEVCHQLCQLLVCKGTPLRSDVSSFSVISVVFAQVWCSKLGTDVVVK